MWKAEKEKQVMLVGRLSWTDFQCRTENCSNHERFAAIDGGTLGRTFQPLMDLNRYWADISVGGPDFEENITVAEIMADNIRKYISS